MDAIECIATRRSIRQFLGTKVDQETILTIVEAGTCAPSSGNIQDWRNIIVDNKDLMKEMYEAAMSQESIHNAAFLVVVCCDPEMDEKHYGLRGERLYSVQNCAAAIQNMLLAAHAIGLGGVWVGAFDENKIRSLLEIPQNIRPQAILAFGYPAEAPPVKNQIDLSAITFFNSYGNKLKNPHRLLKDYHVEWENRIKGAHTALEKLSEMTKKATKNTTETLSKKSSPTLQKYKEKLAQRLKLRRKN